MRQLLPLAAALLACLAAGGARAQPATTPTPSAPDIRITAQIVAACSAASYTAGTVQYVQMDTTGKLCTAASGGGGGGGAVTNAGTFAVQDSATEASTATIVTNTAHAVSSGTDASGAAPSLLTVLATFTVSNAGEYRVQNQSAATLQVILDAGSGTPTIILLAPGAGANAQGADTSPEMTWFVGRVRVAGPAGSQFAATHN